MFRGTHSSAKSKVMFLVSFCKGIHVQQRMAGCELLANGTAGLLRSWDAFNGVNEEKLLYSTEGKTLQFEGVWSTMWTHIKRNFLEFTYGNVYNPICMKILKNTLHIRKNIVMRKGEIYLKQ